MPKRKRPNLGLILAVLTVAAVVVLVLRADGAAARHSLSIETSLQEIISREADASIYPPAATADGQISDAEFAEAKANAEQITAALYDDETVRSRRLRYIVETLERQKQGDLFLTSVTVKGRIEFEHIREGSLIRASVTSNSIDIDAAGGGSRRSETNVSIGLNVLYRIEGGRLVIADLDGQLPRELFAFFDSTFEAESAPARRDNPFGGFHGF